MEEIYSSADYLLQASLREWSGLAILEAMSCGCIPIVSDIPSFRALTAAGQAGRLFPIGDDAALADRVLSLDDAARAALSEEVRAHFAGCLSFAAIARQLDAVYCELTATDAATTAAATTSTIRP
jgi:glycosyltransferase involved in cell wall biosynthesis